MLPRERQQQILLWVEEEGALRVSEISKRLAVSTATIYSDIKPLVKQQLILKSLNGIFYMPKKTHASSYVCSYCNKQSNTRLSVQLIKLNQRIEHTCCAHCGLLRYQQIKKEVSQIICYDFLKDTMISARIATYVINSDIHLNTCQPQVIIFDSMKKAKQFQSGFGGSIHNFEEAIQVMLEAKNGDRCCQPQIKRREKNERYKYKEIKLLRNC
ncbi:DeoR family transcriptional regulator [Bacillus sp. 37MA]|uniref:DeoR family transcriptional regulator n=1 Tax=Bacillus sp. 37MA TaxID=1132442 RepID=UPI00036BB82D|nr:DeoR family transcriptional regulator [Bacillus sp. 37MA]